MAVIGSGVAGALTAFRLASVGLKVTLLEAGPRIARQEAVRRFRYPDLASPYPAGFQHVDLGPDPFHGVSLRMVGGTTWHWLGTALRLHPVDFRMKSLHGVGVDWPLSYADLEPDYTEAERLLGVSGDSLESAGSPRSGPYPMPPLPVTYLERCLPRRYKIQVLPAARNSAVYDGRPACCGAATCVPICPVGAKYDATVHLEKAERLGVRLLDEHPVLRLEVEGGRVARLHHRHGALQARVFLVACHAIQTPRLLLASGISHDAVGRHLMGGTGQVSWALAPEPVYPFRSPQVVSGILQFREGDFRRHRAAFVTSIGNDGWPGHSPPEQARRLIERGLTGQALRDTLRDHVSRQLLLVSNCEELPEPANRVTLADRRDEDGVPLPAVRYRVGDYTRRGLDEAVLVHARLFDAIGATAVNHVEESADPAHIAGTCRMGDDPGTSVVDRDLRCHDLPNLFVVGSAAFPTAGAAPPTLTIAALALRASRAIQEQLSRS
ncbi:MAG: GMC family oxidoreductase [Candidatus Eremiobacterota bacterium]